MLPNVEGKGDQPGEAAWPADQVERRLLSTLIPYARNSRRHSELQVAQIAASIREWGWTTPILVDENDTIIAGHGRVMAASKLGIHDVPVMVARGWSEAQKRAYVIADNKLATNADWDYAALKVELNELAALSFDVAVVGFSMDELSLITSENTATDQVPLPSGSESESKMDKLKWGKFEVPLTAHECELLEAALERHTEIFGMRSGFIEQTFNV